MATRKGLWWRCGNVYVLGVHFSGTEADEIARQVRVACDTAYGQGQYGHKLIELGGRKGYVTIQSDWHVVLPRLDDGSYKLTDDPSRIPTFPRGKDFG